MVKNEVHTMIIPLDNLKVDMITKIYYVYLMYHFILLCY